MASLPLHLFEPVLTAASMRQADARTIRELGLPGRLLMENAGRAAVDVVEQVLGPALERRVLVLCGRGNNGGDGLVIARVLRARGAHVRVALTAPAEDLTADAAANLELLQALARNDAYLQIEMVPAPEDLDRDWPEWTVDALLGIGVRPPLRPPVDGYARAINACRAPCIAVDVATGLHSDTGEAADHAVVADLTVTMAAPKAGLLFREGPRHTGELRVVEIGIPRHELDGAIASGGAGYRSTDAAARTLIPSRKHGAHKYSAGRVFALAGSRAFPGAAALTAQAAARAGAGAVVVATPASAREILESTLTEVMTLPLPETDEGTVAGAALDVILDRASAADAVVIGPGLGRHPATTQLVRDLLERVEARVVIDADGLNALAEDSSVVMRRSPGRNWILTPHLGEMRRLVGDDELDAPPYEIAREWARRLGCTLLLKGAPSVVAAPEEPVLISCIATPAMATAGTGDVLTGVIAGLMAQGLDTPVAAILALHLSGRAAERYARRNRPESMLASDVIAELPAVLRG